MTTCEYEQSKRQWEGLWADVVSEAGEPDHWIAPWIGTGAPHVKDGNPIFSAISPELRRGVRIVQLEPCEADPEEFQFWFQNTEDDPLKPINVQSLVIACALSDAAMKRARELLIKYVKG